VLRGECLLVRLGLGELLAVDNGAATAATAAQAGGREYDARALGVDGHDAVEPRFGLGLGSKPLRRLHGGGQEQDAVGTTGAKTARPGQASLDCRRVEPTRHLSTDNARNGAGRVFAECAAESRTQGGTKLLEAKFLALLRSRRELELEIAQDFGLERRLGPDQIFDGLRQRDFVHPLLEFLGDDHAENIDRLEKSIFDARSRPGGGRFGFGRGLRFVLELVINLLDALGVAGNGTGDRVVLGLYLALSIRDAIPVRAGEGPNSMGRSKASSAKRRSWVSIQRTGEANW
jgi:hypothetical protein